MKKIINSRNLPLHGKNNKRAVWGALEMQAGIVGMAGIVVIAGILGIAGIAIIAGIV